MIYILLVTFAMLVTYYEKKHFKTLMSPTTLMIWPFVAVIAINLSIGKDYGFQIITDSSIGIILIGIFSFFIGELLCIALFQKYERAYTISKVVFSDKFFRNSFRYFVFVVCFIALKYIFVMKSIGLLNYFATDGGSGIITKGLSIHLILSVFPLVPILFERSITERDYKKLIIILGFLVEVFLTYTKYHAIILVVATLFYFVSLRPKAIPVVFVALICIPIFLFGINYYLNFNANGNTLQSEYLIKHLLNYICGGVTYTSTDVNFVIDASFFDLAMSMVTPFFNLFLNGLFGIQIFPAIEIPYILIALGERGNVINFITLMFTTNTPFWGVVFFLLFGFIINKTIGSKRSNQMLRVYVLTIVFLSFFSAYWQLIIPWEIFFWSIVMNKLSKVRIIIRS